jgi:hypothetical protein
MAELDEEVGSVEKMLTLWQLPYSYTIDEYRLFGKFVATFTILCETEKSES